MEFEVPGGGGKGLLQVLVGCYNFLGGEVAGGDRRTRCRIAGWGAAAAIRSSIFFKRVIPVT